VAEPGETCTDGVVSLRLLGEDDVESGSGLMFEIRHEGSTVGAVQEQAVGNEAQLSWTLDAGHRGLGLATRAVRLLVDHAFDILGVRRVWAEIDPRNAPALRVATRSGLRREGLRRLEPGMTDPADSTGLAIYARLASDPPITEPEGFRALLNSFLPRKRAISQLLVRDHDGRVLICRLTYKNDWDLPGGVVEVGESPKLAAAREIEEELALHIDAGPLLPPWGGWDDAVCLVFDGGEHSSGLTDGIVKQAREIREAEFATLEQVRERCADFTARRIESALANLAAGGGPAYVESGGTPPAG
jgi:8-oxo-dGTP pyrophosphatase MutT (NUDIX family)